MKKIGGCRHRAAAFSPPAVGCGAAKPPQPLQTPGLRAQPQDVATALAGGSAAGNHPNTFGILNVCYDVWRINLMNKHKMGIVARIVSVTIIIVLVLSMLATTIVPF
jgi:hypothetical protein